jgi:endonuclease I
MYVQYRSKFLFVNSAIWAFTACAPLFAQTNPTPLTVPVSQNWGVSAFSSMPPGFAAWSGLSGGSITTQAAAEASDPPGNATIMTTTPSDGGTGGCYGYVASGNARFAILSSSNANNGVNQLVMALNTAGQSNISLTYDLINVVANPRAIGAVCQYRVGTSGSWTTLSGTGNPYVQSGGTLGTVTPANITLPVAAENQSVVQIRWAVWRATGSGNSSGFAIDNISVSAIGSGPLITGLVLSRGSNYGLGDTATATVTLSEAPTENATINISSGAFSKSSVTIAAPDTVGETEVSMVNSGTYTAVATAVTGCGGTATSSSFNVVGAPMASFASTGVNTIDDTAGNGDGYIDPGETGINLYFQITNTGTANATGISAALTSLSGTATISNGVEPYPNIAIGGNTSNAAPFQLSLSPGHVCGSTINLQLDITANEGSTLIALSLPTCPPVSDLFSPPADYYLTATGTGATLKSQLHNIISKNYWNGFLNSSTHMVRSYDAAKSGLQVTDLDVNNANNLILIYTGVSVPKSWDSGATWNREHSWPDSRGINGTLPAYSDMHHLRPCNPSINGSRSNKPYGMGSGYWDPDHGAPDRGRAARTLFYMSTRYNGTSPNPSLNLVLVNGQPSGNQMGDSASLLQWHYAYPVDEGERRRNNAVFSNIANPNYYQGNRNPYVDHPEYVWTIYGLGPNDSQIYVDAIPPADGASSASVNLGSIIVNAAIPLPQTVVLNKIGNNPTTYDVVLGGAAISSAAGPRQAFVSASQTRNITAGLAGSTAIAGEKTGSITIDNTDLTSAVAGRGSADGNDAIAISLSVLDHANASFDSPTDQNELTIDFGDANVGSGVVAQPFTIYNLPQTPSFTAGLDLDSIGGTGDTAILATDVLPFTGLSAGGDHVFTAFFDTASAGNYSAIYTLHLSDENLPGALPTAPDLVVTLVGHVVRTPCIAADTNCDLVITIDDIGPFVDLLLNLTTSCSSCAADLNGDSELNGADIQPFINQLIAP